MLYRSPLVINAMPFRPIQVTEYECAKCGYKWINRINGKEGLKPKRCASCKRWDWEEGYLTRLEKRIRRDILKVEDNPIKFSTLDGTGSYSIPTDLCTTFLSIYPRPTLDELRIVLNPICYLGPFDHRHRPLLHKGTCIEQMDCGPGWRRKSYSTGPYDLDDKIYDEMERKEKEVRHDLMQHIIESRKGSLNTSSMHYRYLEDKKRAAKEFIEFDIREMHASAMRLKEQNKDKSRIQR